MTQSLDKPDQDETRRNALEVMYQQVAAQHDKIDDFRSKLLAALPAIAGLSFFFGPGKSTDLNSELFPIIGILGAFVSIGMLVHEIRGIIECYMLWAVGSELELRLTNAQNDDARYGPFSIKYRMGLYPWVGRETAAIIIYSVTIAVWTCIAIWPAIKLWSILPAAAVFIVVASISNGCLARNRCKVADYMQGASAYSPIVAGA